MQEPYEMPIHPSRLRDAMRRATMHLRGGAGLLSLVLVYLFCLVALFALFFGYAMLDFFGWMFFLKNALLLFALCHGMCAIAFFALILPLFSGRVRMTGMVAAGMKIASGDLFWYFRSWRAWWRGMRIALLWPFSFFVPVFFSAVAIATGNGDVSLGAVFSLSRGRVPLRTVLAFWGRVLLHALLSALTLGVLWLLYYSHHTALAYFEMVMEKEEQT